MCIYNYIYIHILSTYICINNSALFFAPIEMGCSSLHLGGQTPQDRSQLPCTANPQYLSDTPGFYQWIPSRLVTTWKNMENPCINYKWMIFRAGPHFRKPPCGVVSKNTGYPKIPMFIVCHHFGDYVYIYMYIHIYIYIYTYIYISQKK
jgi:hypothetical protein